MAICCPWKWFVIFLIAVVGLNIIVMEKLSKLLIQIFFCILYSPKALAKLKIAGQDSHLWVNNISPFCWKISLLL
ncbi:TPA: hypothetical protein DIC40_07785 [Patescibacteria group bacterium]|nr:hypothetical protein [Candidatus Gracilibacteria bacterium]